jgi:hypothetical protein
MHSNVTCYALGHYDHLVHHQSESMTINGQSYFGCQLQAVEAVGLDKQPLAHRIPRLKILIAGIYLVSRIYSVLRCKWSMMSDREDGTSTPLLALLW